MRRGTWLALIGILPVTSFSGCIVTDTVDLVDEPNHPPSIESAPEALHRLDDVIVIELDDEGQPLDIDAIVLDVIIRDPNVDQDLVVRGFFDRRPDSVQCLRRRLEAVAPEGGGERPVARTPEPFRCDLAGSVFLLPGCHLIEMLVSGGFQEMDQRQPLEAGDIGSAFWWVATTTPGTGGGTIDPTECRR